MKYLLSTWVIIALQGEIFSVLADRPKINYFNIFSPITDFIACFISIFLAFVYFIRFNCGVIEIILNTVIYILLVFFIRPHVLFFASYEFNFLSTILFAIFFALMYSYRRYDPNRVDYLADFSLLILSAIVFFLLGKVFQSNKVFNEFQHSVDVYRIIFATTWGYLAICVIFIVSRISSKIHLKKLNSVSKKTNNTE